MALLKNTCGLIAMAFGCSMAVFIAISVPPSLWTALIILFAASLIAVFFFWLFGIGRRGAEIVYREPTQRIYVEYPLPTLPRQPQHYAAGYPHDQPQTLPHQSQPYPALPQPALLSQTAQNAQQWQRAMRAAARLTQTEEALGSERIALLRKALDSGMSLFADDVQKTLVVGRYAPAAPGGWRMFSRDSLQLSREDVMWLAAQQHGMITDVPTDVRLAQMHTALSPQGVRITALRS